MSVAGPPASDAAAPDKTREARSAEQPGGSPLSEDTLKPESEVYTAWSIYYLHTFIYVLLHFACGVVYALAPLELLSAIGFHVNVFIIAMNTRSSPLLTFRMIFMACAVAEVTQWAD